MQTKTYSDRKIWFSMWFLGAVVTFGLAFFPMFYRLVDGRNKHFRHEAEWDKQVVSYLKSFRKQVPELEETLPRRNAKAWALSIILIIPVFLVVYLLSRDLVVHESAEDAFLSAAFPKKMFMPQTVPIKTYVVITIATLGVGVVYWLYKVVNLYNAHYKAQMVVEEEVGKLMEEKGAVG